MSVQNKGKAFFIQQKRIENIGKLLSVNKPQHIFR